MFENITTVSNRFNLNQHNTPNIFKNIPLEFYDSTNWDNQSVFIKTYFSWAKNYVNNTYIQSVNDSTVIDNIINTSNNNNNLILEHIIYLITNNLYLHYINIYILFMLAIIITCRYLIGDNNQDFLLKLKNLPFGNYIYKAVSWYINIWVKASIIWIYYMIIIVIIFNCVSIYSFYHLISILT